MLYKFLVESNLIDSVEEIKLQLNAKFDCDILFKLISEYKSKFFPESTFTLSYFLKMPYLDIYSDIYNLWIDKIKKHSALNYKEIDTDDISKELSNKCFVKDDELNEKKNEFFYYFKKKLFSFDEFKQAADVQSVLQTDEIRILCLPIISWVD